MAEIKSTLDLVMEKTRHMTLSKAEQEAQREAEIQKTLRGLIQKYLDLSIRKDQFLAELQKIATRYRTTPVQILRTETLSRIELECQSEILELLAFACNVDVAPLRAVLKEFATRRDAAKVDRIHDGKRQLEQQLKISGSAVVPNLENDTVLAENVSCLKATYTKRLEDIKEKLLALPIHD